MARITNLVTNPRAKGRETPSVNLPPDWVGQWFGGGSGTGTYTTEPGVGLRKLWLVDGTSNWDVGFGVRLTVTPGQVISASISQIVESAPGLTSMSRRLIMRFALGTTNISSVLGEVVPVIIGQKVTYFLKNVTVPDGVDTVFIRDEPASSNGTVGPKVGTAIVNLEPIVEIGTEVGPYFDGDTPPFRYGPTAQLVIPKWSGTPGQSSSYFDYEEPWTVGMQWDKAVDRRFELGVDRGVLYNRSMVGVPWNGLINVTEKLTNTEITRYYQDGSKYYTDLSTPEFSATVEAFTYPDILDTFTGKTEIVNGLYADENAFQFFHFSYRTFIGDAVYGSDKFYKIHLVYHAYAVPTAKAYGTINESPSASTFSWDVTTDSISTLPGTNNLWTSHLIIDSRKVPASKLKNLETILYGTSTISPRLPLPAEVRTILA